MAFPVKALWHWLVICLMMPGTAAAQMINDPTRPPADYAGQKDGGGVEQPVSGGGQIIILSPGRQQVTINGETARPGGTLGNRTLVGASDSEIVLRNGAEVERSGLYGGVKKQPRSAQTSEGRRSPTRGAVDRK